MTNTLQTNMSCWQPDGGLAPMCDRFVWNKFLLHGLAAKLGPDAQEWMLPVLYGYFQQKGACVREAARSCATHWRCKGRCRRRRRLPPRFARAGSGASRAAAAAIPSCSHAPALGRPLNPPLGAGSRRSPVIQLSEGQELRLTLVARRSTRFAGTRYMRRGVNSQGDVANEVETELVLETDSLALGGPPRFASLVQVRGSIPLSWRHTNLLSPKPDVQITQTDMQYRATRRHYDRLFRRHGYPVVSLNLIKVRPPSPPHGHAHAHAQTHAHTHTRARARTRTLSAEARALHTHMHVRCPVSRSPPLARAATLRSRSLSSARRRGRPPRPTTPRPARGA